VADGSATVRTTANAVVLSAQTGATSFTSTVLEARTTVAPSGTFYLIKVLLVIFYCGITVDFQDAFAFFVLWLRRRSTIPVLFLALRGTGLPQSL
jgi:hypothetical protein